MNILITGATSASGIAAIKYYASKGKVFALARDYAKLDSLKKEFDITPIRLDFCDSPEIFIENLKNAALPRIDIIIHLCAAIPRTAKSATEYYLVNLINSRNLIDNLPLSSNIKILNFSSASVYDMDSAHLHENAALNVTHDYGLSKHCFERFLEYKMESLQKESQECPFALNARIPVLLTQGVQSNFISKWRDDLKNGNSVKLFNPDSLFNSCVWIGDIFSFFDNLISHDSLSVSNKKNCVSCNLGIQDQGTIRETFEFLCEAMNISGSTEIIKNDRIAQNFDCSKAIELGYKGSTLKQAIRKFVST